MMQYVLLAMLMLTWQEVAELNRVMTAKHNEVGQRFFETVQLLKKSTKFASHPDEMASILLAKYCSIYHPINHYNELKQD